MQSSVRSLGLYASSIALPCHGRSTVPDAERGRGGRVIRAVRLRDFIVQPLVCASTFACSAALADAQVLSVSRTDAPVPLACEPYRRSTSTAGWPDVVSAGTARNSIQVFINPRQTKQPFVLAGEYAAAAGPFDLAAAASNQDGFEDLAMANSDSDSLTILRGRSGGSFPSPGAVSAPGNPGWIGAGPRFAPTIFPDSPFNRKANSPRPERTPRCRNAGVCWANIKQRGPTAVQRTSTLLAQSVPVLKSR